LLGGNSAICPNMVLPERLICFIPWIWGVAWLVDFEQDTTAPAASFCFSAQRL
jgi:hypothetical protein